MTLNRMASPARAIASATIAALLAVLAMAGIAQPASAAPTDAPVSGATLTWAVRDAFLSHLFSPTPTPGTITLSGANISQPNGGVNPFVWSGGAGSLDLDSRDAEVSYTGSVNFQKTYGPGQFFDLTIRNPKIQLTSATAGGLFFDTVDSEGATATIKIANLQLNSPTSNGSELTYTNVPATFTAAGGAFFNYPAGDPAAPVSFTLPYEELPAEPVQTSLNLAISPSGTSTAGEEVQLVATFTPAVQGELTFHSAQRGVLDTVPTTASSTVPQVFTSSSFPQGEDEYWVVYTPTDLDAYLASESARISHEVLEDTENPAVETTTTVTVTPDHQTTQGTEVSFTATVSAEGTAAPSGSVRFLAHKDGQATPTVLGTVALTGGSATYTAAGATALAGGGYVITAEFQSSTNEFSGSQGEAPVVIRVVDTSGPDLTLPSSTAQVGAETAVTRWGISTYSVANSHPNPWARHVNGDDFSADGTDFLLTQGQVTADSRSAIIEYAGTLVIGIQHFDVKIIDPYIVLNANGAGGFYGQVDLVNRDTETTLSSHQDVLIGAFVTPENVGPGFSGPVSIPMDFTGATAAGTWATGYADSWSNEFIWNLDNSIRAYFYRTSNTAAQDNKGASPLELAFDWPFVQDLSLAASPAGSAALGDSVTLTATVTPVAPGDQVEFTATNVGTSTPVTVGAATVQQDGTASLTTTALQAGSNQIEARLLPDGGSDVELSDSIAHFAIVDTAEAPVCTPTGAVQTRTGVTADWAWSGYSEDWTKIGAGNIHVAGETFILNNGTATYTPDCVAIDFTGTLRVQAYEGFFPPNGQWIELVDPRLTINAQGEGSWSAGLRTGIAAYDSQAAAPRTVITTITGAQFPDFTGTTVNQVVDLDYAGTTAPGTWAVTEDQFYQDAWSNKFVSAVPSAIRSFYYASGANGDSRKAPEPLNLQWNRAPLTLTVSVAGGKIVPGQTLTFTGTGFSSGEQVNATVHSDPVNLGNKAATQAGQVSFTWTVPADFIGNHRIVLTGSSGVISQAFTVTPSAVVPEEEPEPEPTCVARSVRGATLSWGVKDSFRNYISSPVSNGGITSSGISTSGSTFRWSGGQGTYNQDADRGRVSFNGWVRFSGHEGQLDLQLRNPRIQVNSSSSATLIVDVNSKSLQGADVNARGLAFATLRLPAAQTSGGSISWTNARATLTAGGAEAFGGFYNAGDALDSVSFSFPLGGEVDCDRGSADAETLASLPATGADTNLAWVVLALLTLGAAGVALGRRRITALK